jgi:hypothetical protein
MKIEKSIISSICREDASKQDLLNYKAMSKLDRLGLITYLRESFYGEEASTGRLQRVFEFTQR